MCFTLFLVQDLNGYQEKQIHNHLDSESFSAHLSLYFTAIGPGGDKICGQSEVIWLEILAGHLSSPRWI